MLPDPSEGRAIPHAGYRWAWVEETTEGRLGWRFVPVHQSKPCRWMENRQSCKEPSVAKMMRSDRPGSNNWWHYCAEHLYGSVVHDGSVWSARLVPDTDTADA